MLLSDALTQLRATSDLTHKFWAYYQAFTAAAVGFAWASSRPPSQFIVGLAVAYAIFALFNCRLVVTSQSATLVIWRSIQAYKAGPAMPIPPELLPILELNKPDDPKLVGAVHLALSVSATLAMLARNCLAR